jgi:hypothetical protein
MYGGFLPPSNLSALIPDCFAWDLPFKATITLKKATLSNDRSSEEYGYELTD